MRQRAILFDLDETLLDDDAGMRRAVREVATRLTADGRVDASYVERTFLEVSDAFWRNAGSAAHLTDGHQARVDVWREVLEACGYRGNGESVAATLYAEARERHYTLFPDVLAVLRSLRSRAPLALVTNGAPSTQRAKLRVTGLEPQFEAIVISGELGIGKPDPRIFWHVLERLGCPPSAAVHIGDSLEDDVAGARAAGVTGVWLNRRRAVPTKQVRHEIATLDDLPPFLDGL